MRRSSQRLVTASGCRPAVVTGTNMMLLALVALPAATGAAQAKGGLPQLNAPDFTPQLIWLAITFIALYILMARLALPRIGKVIEERRDRIQRDLDEAERLKLETEKALAAYEDALAQARGKAGVIVKGTRDKLTAEVDEQRARVEKQIATNLAEAEARIAKTKSQAMSHVNEIAAGTAEAIVAKLVGTNVSPEEVRRAVKAAAGE